MHAVKKELPAAASECVGHAEHVLSDVCPTAAEYLPAPQSVQVSADREITRVSRGTYNTHQTV